MVWLEWTSSGSQEIATIPRKTTGMKRYYEHHIPLGLGSYSAWHRLFEVRWLITQKLHTKINFPYLNNCNKQSPTKVITLLIHHSLFFLLGPKHTCSVLSPPCLVPSTLGSEGRKSELGLTKQRLLARQNCYTLFHHTDVQCHFVWIFIFLANLCNAKQRAFFVGVFGMSSCLHVGDSRQLLVPDSQEYMIHSGYSVEDLNWFAIPTSSLYLASSYQHVAIVMSSFQFVEYWCNKNAKKQIIASTQLATAKPSDGLQRTVGCSQAEKKRSKTGGVGCKWFSGFDEFDLAKISWVFPHGFLSKLFWNQEKDLFLSKFHAIWLSDYLYWEAIQYFFLFNI